MSTVLQCLDEVLAGLDRTKSGETLDIRDIYGHDKSDIELLKIIEGTEFLISKGAHVKFVTKDGKYAITRHAHNQLRGDASSVQGHKLSMQTVGMLQELGGEPFFVQAEDVTDDETFRACHFASRCEGLYEAWMEDVDKTCKPVQLSIESGLRKCHI